MFLFNFQEFILCIWDDKVIVFFLIRDFVFVSIKLEGL